MPKGGPRPNAGGKRTGAGRPKGAPNKASAERAANVTASGLTPLDIMIETMRHYRGMAAKYQESDEAKSLEYLRMAAVVGKDAAPYVHQRLASTDGAGAGMRDLSTLTDTELDALERISRKIAGAYGHTG